MDWEPYYILESINSKAFEELPTQTHSVELKINASKNMCPLKNLKMTLVGANVSPIRIKEI